jgi:hypothetical protein
MVIALIDYYNSPEKLIKDLEISTSIPGTPVEMLQLQMLHLQGCNQSGQKLDRRGSIRR